MTDVTVGGTGSGSGSTVTTTSDSWFEAIAQAWGTAMDAEAQKLSDMSNQINSGTSDQPSELTMLSAESERMNFLANSEANSISSIGQALQTMARKQ
jgi:hypothetical protein